MSGLDPIGRREVRDIMLRLRDKGTTVFFSSHILADAEALCSRVAVVAGGKLVASGRVAELVSVHTKGWELIVTDLPDAIAAELAAGGATLTRGVADRTTIVLPTSTSPDDVLAKTKAAGATLVSLVALRESLEDVFLEKVRDSQRRIAS
jgi:ABC-2 type transport system ATP-binding protein